MRPTTALATLLLTGLLGHAQAQTTVTDAVVRSTVAQQKATGAFFTITSAKGGKLVSASTPVAGVAEIHEMSMDGSVMKMRALPNGLALPAGTAVSLKPGGYHVMLMDLKAPLKAGDTVDLTLVVQAADGKKETVAVKAAVKAAGNAGATMPMGEHPHGGMGHAKP
jgi:copper(I)-binding protein